MIYKTIEEIEARIRASTNLEEPKRAELLDLQGSLKAEVAGVAKAHGGDSEGPHVSVEKFERDHPVLTRAVNDFCTYFSSLGI